MSPQKKNNITNELMAGLQDERYRSLLIDKINWLEKLNISLILFSNPVLISEEGITHGGKVSWEKVTAQKKALSLTLNMIHFTGIELMIVFLHECGHVKDMDNDSIELQTLDSEISAWRHAINDLVILSPTEKEKASFARSLRAGLESYRADDVLIDSILKSGDLA